MRCADGAPDAGARTGRHPYGLVVVSGRGGLGTYAVLLSSGHVVRPFAASVVGRLPISMAPLGILLLVQAERGSYALAGLATGAFAVGTAVGSPVWGRTMDRLGQARVLAPTVLGSAGLLAALASATVAGAPSAALVALAGGAGALFPPLGAAMRSSWRSVVPDPVQRRAGYALDAAAVELIFVGGPLLLSLLLVLAPAVAPLLVTAGLLAAGGLAYCATGPARWRPGDAGLTVPAGPDGGEATSAGRRRTGSAVGAAGVPALLVVSAAMAVGFGAIDTSLAATARDVLDDEGRLGVLFAAIAGGSTLGGLAYGTSGGHEREHRRLPLFLGVFSVGLAPVPFLLAAGRPPLVTLLPLLFLAGLAIAPSLIVMQNLLDALVPAGRSNEAQAWLSTSITSGVAGGTALAGVLIDAVGVAASFAGAVAAVAVAALVALACQRTWTASSASPDRRDHVGAPAAGGASAI